MVGSLTRTRSVGRRKLIIGAVGSYLFFQCDQGKAQARTGIDVLDAAAISVANPSGVVLEAITMAGQRLVVVGEHGVIAYSDDNGTHWTQAQVPVNVTLTCVAFATPMIGWAAGHFGVVLKTIDGGKSWDRQLDGLQANKLTLEAAQNIPADEANLPTAPFALKRAEIFMDGGANKPFLALAVLSTSRVIAFGAYRMTMATADGGSTWSDVSLAVEDRFSNNLYDATIVGTDIFVVGEAGLVFRSTDDGATFPQVASPGSVTLFGIVAARDGSILVYGVAGSVFRTVDAGVSWAQIEVPTQDNLTAAKVLRSGEIVLASEAGDLFLSADNGTSFSPVSGASPLSVFDIEQSTDGSLVMVGGAGVRKESINVIAP